MAEETSSVDVVNAVVKSEHDCSSIGVVKSDEIKLENEESTYMIYVKEEGAQPESHNAGVERFMENGDHAAIKSEKEDHFNEYFKQEYDEEMDFKHEEASVLTIAPISSSESDREIDEGAEATEDKSDDETDKSDCQVTNCSEGRNHPQKKIKLESDDEHARKPLVKDAASKVVKKQSNIPTKNSSCTQFTLKTLDPFGSALTVTFSTKELQKCLICNKNFISAKALETHNINEHSVEIQSLNKQSAQTHNINKKSSQTYNIIEHSAAANLSKTVMQKRIQETQSIRNCILYSNGHTTKCPVCLLEFPAYLRQQVHPLEHLKTHFGQLLTCGICEQGFTRGKNLERHLSFHDGRKFHYCHICGERFEKLFMIYIGLEEHMAMHGSREGGLHPVPKFLSDHVKIMEDLSRYRCNICGMEFMKLTGLLSHLEQHKGSNLSCSACGKEYIWEADINIRMCTAHPDVCSICGEGNLTTRTFADHVQTHYGQFYSCGICEQGFTQKENLDKHMLSCHSGDAEVHSCHICRKIIHPDGIVKHMDLHKSVLDNHLPSYFNEQIKLSIQTDGCHRRHICNLCGYLNHEVPHVVSHLLGHLKMSFACDTCGVEFISFKELATHKKSHVSTDRNGCYVCKQKFLHKDDLVRHSDSHFGMIHTCPICSQGFMDPQNLVKHESAIHYGNSMDQCHVCGLSFKTEGLPQHMLVHRGAVGNKIPLDLASRVKLNSSVSGTFVCSICGIGYPTLSRLCNHLRLHTKEDSFCCDICGTEFVQIATLSDHRLQAHSRIKRAVTVEHSYAKRQ